VTEHGPARHRDRVRGAGTGEGARGVRATGDPPRDRLAGLRHAAAHRRGRDARAARRPHPLLPGPGPARAAPGLRRAPLGAPRHRPRSRPRPGRSGREAVPLLRRARHLPARRRGHLPEPRVSDLRVGDPLRRRGAGAAAAGRGARLRVHGRRPVRAAQPAHAARDPELAREPDRRDRAAGADRRDRRGAGRARLLRALRRGLLGDALRRSPRHRRRPPWPTRPHHPPGRLLEDLRDDRLAARLRGAPGRARRAGHAPLDQLRVVHGAGVAALTGPRGEVDAMLAEFERRRAAVVEGLNALPGVTCVMPQGAFYAFPNISGTGMEARTVADRLLEEAGVAVLSGTAFGSYGEGYLRLSYANSLDNIAEALAAMGELLEAVAV